MSMRPYSLVVFLILIAAFLPIVHGQQMFQVSFPQANLPLPVHVPLAASMSSVNSEKSGQYWFQVGAWAANGPATNGPDWGSQFGRPVTGTSVEIRINYKHSFSLGAYGVVYWVGINLPGDAFIQVGYGITATEAYPQWFWEYFLPGTASAASGPVLGEWGNEIGPNGTWYKFSLQSSGTRWYAFVNDAQIGSVDLGVSTSGSNGPFAVAEIPGIRNANTLLGPVEFRNLQYRDVSSSWHNVSWAVSLCCFGAGSDTQPVTSSFPYGVESVPGENNYWLAGSNLDRSIREEGDYLWPWYRVTVTLPVGFSSALYSYGQTINLPYEPATVSITENSRYLLEGWYVNGTPENQLTLTAVADMVVKPWYVKQYFVQVSAPLGTVTGSGWFNEGAIDTISVNPWYSIPASGILANFGVKSVLVGWTGDYNGPAVNGESTIIVKSPMAITAVWRTDYGILPYYSLLIILAFVATIYLHRREHKSNQSAAEATRRTRLLAS